MSYQALERFKKLNYLIKMKATGNPKSLSKKLNVSERTVYIYLMVLKANGAPIKYNRTRESYYYLEDGGFEFDFKKNKYL